MKENSKMICLKGKELAIGTTVEFTMDIGKMGSDMEKECSSGRTAANI